MGRTRGFNRGRLNPVMPVVSGLPSCVAMEVIGSFLRQFPQKHRVEASPAAVVTGCAVDVVRMLISTQAKKDAEKGEFIIAVNVGKAIIHHPPNHHF